MLVGGIECQPPHRRGRHQHVAVGADRAHAVDAQRRGQRPERTLGRAVPGVQRQGLHREPSHVLVSTEHDAPCGKVDHQLHPYPCS